jgi:hypothetical protein
MALSNNRHDYLLHTQEKRNNNTWCRDCNKHVPDPTFCPACGLMKRFVNQKDCPQCTKMHQTTKCVFSKGIHVGSITYKKGERFCNACKLYIND